MKRAGGLGAPRAGRDCVHQRHCIYATIFPKKFPRHHLFWNCATPACCARKKGPGGGYSLSRPPPTSPHRSCYPYARRSARADPVRQPPRPYEACDDCADPEALSCARRSMTEVQDAIAAVHRLYKPFRNSSFAGRRAGIRDRRNRKIIALQISAELSVRSFWTSPPASGFGGSFPRSSSSGGARR